MPAGPAVKVEMQNPSFDLEQAALRAWLDAVAAGYATKYADVLIDEGYDSISEIQLATEQDLRDAGVKKAHARRIVAAIATLTGVDDAGSAAATPAHVTVDIAVSEAPTPRDMQRNAAAASEEPARSELLTTIHFVCSNCFCRNLLSCFGVAYLIIAALVLANPPADHDGCLYRNNVIFFGILAGLLFPVILVSRTWVYCMARRNRSIRHWTENSCYCFARDDPPLPVPLQIAETLAISSLFVVANVAPFYVFSGVC